MPKIFNQKIVAKKNLARHATTQVLLDSNTTSKDNIFLERWELKPTAQIDIKVSLDDIVWVQILEGSMGLTSSHGENTLDRHHIAFLPPAFEGAIVSSCDTILLHARIPNAARFDRQFKSNPPSFKVIDWSKEPVLSSTHDARKRIYFVTPKLFSTKAISGEMIIYPPGTVASNHYHEGAEHFQYVMSGEGIVYLNEEPFRLKKGDILYNYERERHYFECDKSEDFIFVEFFAQCFVIHD